MSPRWVTPEGTPPGAVGWVTPARERGPDPDLGGVGGAGSGCCEGCRRLEGAPAGPGGAGARGTRRCGAMVALCWSQRSLGSLPVTAGAPVLFHTPTPHPPLLFYSLLAQEQRPLTLRRGAWRGTNQTPPPFTPGSAEATPSGPRAAGAAPAPPLHRQSRPRGWGTGQSEHPTCPIASGTAGPTDRDGRWAHP